MKKLLTVALKTVQSFFSALGWSILAFIASTIVVAFFTFFVSALTEGTPREQVVSSDEKIFRILMLVFWLGMPAFVFVCSFFSGFREPKVEQISDKERQDRAKIHAAAEEERKKREAWEYKHKRIRRFCDYAIFPWEEDLPGMTREEYDKQYRSSDPFPF